LQSTLSFCDARAKADENILAAYTDEHTWGRAHIKRFIYRRTHMREGTY
jgi:hypothetical protein